jgi:hypothetical protein
VFDKRKKGWGKAVDVTRGNEEIEGNNEMCGGE